LILYVEEKYPELFSNHMPLSYRNGALRRSIGLPRHSAKVVSHLKSETLGTALVGKFWVLYVIFERQITEKSMTVWTGFIWHSVGVKWRLL
jgi:hypothetical protein